MCLFNLRSGAAGCLVGESHKSPFCWGWGVHLELLGSVWAWPDSQPFGPSPWCAGPASGTAAGWTVGPKAAAHTPSSSCGPTLLENSHSEGGKETRKGQKKKENVRDSSREGGKSSFTEQIFKNKRVEQLMSVTCSISSSECFYSSVKYSHSKDLSTISSVFNPEVSWINLLDLICITFSIPYVWFVIIGVTM